jgi:hypothetical protein
MVTSFMWVAGNGTTIRFLRKKVTFCFNRPRNPDADARSRGVGSSKDFEIHGALVNQDLPDAPFIKPIDTVICPK